MILCVYLFYSYITNLINLIVLLAFLYYDDRNDQLVVSHGVRITPLTIAKMKIAAAIGNAFHLLL